MPIEGGCLITGIRTYPKYRGKGLARQALRMIIEDADKEGVTLFLAAAAEPWDNQKWPGISQEALLAWYKRYGFQSFDPVDPTQLRR
jgi:GNAT superfamily N-acetyltransferase